MKKGDLVLIPFPFTDLTGAKNRPALILIERELDITVSFITTQINWQDEFDLPIEPSVENGIKKNSLIRLSKMTTLSKELVIGRLGSLTEVQVSEVNQQLIKLLKLA